MILIFFDFSFDESELLKTLFEEQNIKMYNIANSLLHHADDAQEAVQDAFVRIAENIEKINNLPCPERVPYCVVIVKNISKNMIRGKKPQISLTDLDFIAESDGNPQEEFFGKADIAMLSQSIKQLSPPDREIILMKWGKTMKFKDIGEVLGIGEDAATKRGQRALKRLRDVYLKENPNV